MLSSKRYGNQKIAKAYTLEEATLIAARHEIVADKGDTVETLIQVLLEEFEESKNKIPWTI